MAWRAPTKGADGKYRGSPGRAADSGGSSGGGGGSSGGGGTSEIMTLAQLEAEKEAERERRIAELTQKIEEKNKTPTINRSQTTPTIRGSSGGSGSFQPQQDREKLISLANPKPTPAEIQQPQQISKSTSFLNLATPTKQPTTQTQQYTERSQTYNKEAGFVVKTPQGDYAKSNYPSGNPINMFSQENLDASFMVLPLPFGFLGKAGQATKAAKAGKAIKNTIQKVKPALTAVAESKAGQATKAALNTKIGKFITGGAKTAVASYTTAKATEAAIKVTAPKEQREYLKDKSIFADPFAVEQLSVNQQKWYKKAANQVSLFIGDKEAYKGAAERLATQKGLTGQAKEDFIGASMRARSAKGFSEVAGLLSLSANTEIIGQGFVTRGFLLLKQKGKQYTQKQVGKKAFVEGFKTIAPAGVVEGATGEFLQENIRGEKYSLKKIGLMGLAGGATAGFMGGGIVGTSINKPTTSKVLTGISYITDPYEYIGDVTARGVTKVSSKVTKKPIIQPAIFTTNSKENPIFSFGTTKTPATTPATKPKTPVNIPVQQPATIFTKKPTSRASTPINSIIGSIAPTNTPTDTPIQPPVNPPVQPPVSIPVNTPTNINTNTFLETTNTPVNTPTNIMTNIFSNVPVVTPMLRVPPPVPLMLPTGFGVGSSRITKQTKFIDELAIGKNLFAGLTGSYGLPKPIKKKTKKDKKEKKKKYIFDPMAFIFGK